MIHPEKKFTGSPQESLKNKKTAELEAVSRRIQSEKDLDKKIMQLEEFIEQLRKEEKESGIIMIGPNIGECERELEELKLIRELNKESKKKY